MVDCAYVEPEIVNVRPKPDQPLIEVDGKLRFSLSGERHRMDYRLDMERDWLDESFEIKVCNRKEQGSIGFRVQVPAGQEKIVAYRAHYTW